MLASAAVASADEPRIDAETGASSVASPELPELPDRSEPALAPPGMTEPALAPPGMVAPVDCDDADALDARTRLECTATGGVIVRNGFGHYFWVSGG
jgi:hypothetical protein